MESITKYHRPEKYEIQNNTCAIKGYGNIACNFALEFQIIFLNDKSPILSMSLSNVKAIFWAGLSAQVYMVALIEVAVKY